MKGYGSKYWFFTKILILNVATGLMFFTISQKPALPQSFIVNPSQVSSISQKSIKIGFPTRIVVPSLKMDLKVDKGSFDPKTGSWTVADDRVFYADSSVPPNNSNGMTLIYGHGTEPVFGDLVNLKEGQEAIVYSDTGYVFHYKYKSVKMASPNDTGIFSQSGPPRMMLQTCAGPYDSYRALYTFYLTGVDGS